MTVFFTSDTHFGHQNIIKYCNRPFSNVGEMNEVIINNWNALVMPGDVVYHLGDVALGDINKSLECVRRLVGHKILILGNHDRPFMREGKPDQNKWFERYEEVFDEVFHWDGIFQNIGRLGPVVLSHFPYSGDSQERDRYRDCRPEDKGSTLIHGHTHSKERLTFSSKGTPQVHVGVDAWNFAPVPISVIASLLAPYWATTKSTTHSA